MIAHSLELYLFFILSLDFIMTSERSLGLKYQNLTTKTS